MTYTDEYKAKMTAALRAAKKAGRDLREAAAALGVPYSTAHRWIRGGGMPGGSSPDAICREEILNWITEYPASRRKVIARVPFAAEPKQLEAAAIREAARLQTEGLLGLRNRLTGKTVVHYVERVK